MASETKDTNPKDSIGIEKVPSSVIPVPVEMEIGLALLEGACKYGAHNYRECGVRASVYYDACRRHLGDWWEGTDMDPGSGSLLHHVTKAIAGLVVLRDSMLQGNWVDDRPPKSNPGFVEEYNKIAKAIMDRAREQQGELKPRYTEVECRKSLPLTRKPQEQMLEQEQDPFTFQPVVVMENVKVGDGKSTHLPDVSL